MPYLANIEGIIWLVVIVGSVIGQVVKASRKVQAQAPKQDAERARAARAQQRPSVTGSRPAGSQQGAGDPAAELRKFFETIGVPIPEVTPAPVSKPVQAPVSDRAGASTVRQQVARAHTRAMRAKQSSRRAVAMPAPVAVAPAAAMAYQQQRPVAVAAPTTEDVKLVLLGRKKTTDTNRDLLKLLQGRHSLRQAVVLREVLGPPLALR